MMLPQREGQIRVLAYPQFGKAANLPEHRFFDTHIKTSRLKLSYRSLFPPNAAGGEKGSHRIRNGLLHQVETPMGTVGTTKSVARILPQVGLHIGDIFRWQLRIRIQENQPVIFGPRCPVISGKTRAGIGFFEITDAEQLFKLGDGGLQWDLRTVINHQNFKRFVGLPNERI